MESWSGSNEEAAKEMITADKSESFDCICGEHFGSIAGLQKHWETNNTVTTGRPHYRLITGGSSEDLEGAVARTQPPMRKDGPQ